MSTADHVHVTKTTNPDTARRASPEQRRTLLGIGLGNALETFDWAAYALFAPFFATQIFNPADPGAALLATFAVFGAGFLIRPFGAIAFGWIADRKGRKFSLIAAILCASAGLLLIGLAPTYENAGLLGAGILLLARLLQGVAHTGEVAAAYTYIAEVAPPARRGLWSSVIYASGLTATLLASLFGTLLTAILDHEQMTSWGWRIPFLAGAALGLFTLVINALLLYLVGVILRPHFIVETFWSAFLGSLIISIVSVALNVLTGSGNTQVTFRHRQRPPDSDRDGGGPVIDV